jgi:UDP-glucose 4-epimerase
MRTIVLGGTGFVGAAVVEDLHAHGHDVLVVHRGQREPSTFPNVEHLRVDRRNLLEHRKEVEAFRPDAVVDCFGMSRGDTEPVVAALPRNLRLVVLSSQDVYRAYASFQAGIETDAVPIDESAPVRSERFPYRGKYPGFDDYEKLDVEELYRSRGGIALRLPMVYGERDQYRREEFILSRVRAGRSHIPFGPGTLLWSRGYVRDVASGVRLALSSSAPGEVFNLCEANTWSLRSWAAKILDAAGSRAELVDVPEPALPPDLMLTKSPRQQLLFDARKARDVLGWRASDPNEALRRSVRWHLENPPAARGFDPTADERALAETPS